MLFRTASETQLWRYSEPKVRLNPTYSRNFCCPAILLHISARIELARARYIEAGGWNTEQHREYAGVHREFNCNFGFSPAAISYSIPANFVAVRKMLQ
jgi:hypothetical protein